MSEPLPDIATCEWPVDWRCYGTEDEVAAIDPDLKALAESLATSSLHALTLGQVGGCPITVRPVSLGCVRHYGFDFLDGAWMIPVSDLVAAGHLDPTAPTEPAPPGPDDTAADAVRIARLEAELARAESEIAFQRDLLMQLATRPLEPA